MDTDLDSVLDYLSYLLAGVDVTISARDGVIYLTTTDPMKLGTTHFEGYRIVVEQG